MKTVNNVLFVAGFCMVALIVSCKKVSIPAYGNEIIVPPTDTQRTVLYSGVLIGGEMGDRARGDVTIEKVGSIYYLVFKNFSSYNGPDIHVYFSKTIGSNAMPPTDYIDVGLLKYRSGNFNYQLGGPPDVVNYRYVLIWCAQYRIQFGYTAMQ